MSAPFEAIDGECPDGPVVLVFGWVGAQPRLLGKYAAACAASARRVYHATARTLDIFANHAAVRALAERALELLARAHAREPAVLMYLSNGGAFVHVAVLRLLDEDARRARAARRFADVRVRGTVFDSAPAWLSHHSTARALTAALRGGCARRAAYVAARALLPPTVWLLWGGLRARAYFDELAADALDAHALYIYSEHDDITDAARLDALVARRRAAHARGAAAVRTLRIGADEAASPHVSHLVVHADRYRTALAALLGEAARGE
jgi:hypothetical protein